MTLREKLEALRRYDTPSVTNVVASYPKAPQYCLTLYDAWYGKWYTDQRIRCMYPELGAVAGLAVTCTYALPGTAREPKTLRHVLREIRAKDAPVIVVIHQDMPEEIGSRNGLCGGNMMTAFKATGAVGVLSDGPSRDIDEVRPMKMQYLLTGVTPGHGPFEITRVNTPVEICGMEVADGDVIHMDENGAVKFPLDRLDDVLERLAKLSARESDCMRRVREAGDDVELIADINAETFKY